MTRPTAEVAVRLTTGPDGTKRWAITCLIPCGCRFRQELPAPDRGASWRTAHAAAVMRTQRRAHRLYRQSTTTSLTDTKGAAA